MLLLNLRLRNRNAQTSYVIKCIEIPLWRKGAFYRENWALGATFQSTIQNFVKGVKMRKWSPKQHQQQLNTKEWLAHVLVQARLRLVFSTHFSVFGYPDTFACFVYYFRKKTVKYLAAKCFTEKDRLYEGTYSID